MDFIVENEMQLLISLDGNETGQSYRTDHHGKNSFNRVFSNIQLLKQKHPDYFEKYVQFNSVLHNRNSVEEIFYFFKKNFNKTPMITSLNTGGIKDEKREEFSKMYKNVRDSLTKTDKREAIEFEMFTKSPVINDIAHYIHFCNNNVFETYNDLFFNSHKHAIIPTGTCIPF